MTRMLVSSWTHFLLKLKEQELFQSPKNVKGKYFASRINFYAESLTIFRYREDADFMLKSSYNDRIDSYPVNFKHKDSMTIELPITNKIIPTHENSTNKYNVITAVKSK